jgi:hypothetical protein
MVEYEARTRRMTDSLFGAGTRSAWLAMLLCKLSGILNCLSILKIIWKGALKYLHRKEAYTEPKY